MTPRHIHWGTGIVERCAFCEQRGEIKGLLKAARKLAKDLSGEEPAAAAVEWCRAEAKKLRGKK